jgi:endoglucanase
MRRESLQFLERLLTTPSPSGFETRGQAIWLDYVKAFADKWHTDAYGNAYACLNPGGSPKVMLTGHSDEIGLMVSYINDKGFIHVAQIGGLDTGLMRGKRVDIHNARGTVRGVTGATAIHLIDREKGKKKPEQHEIFIDIGATSKAETLERIQIGDPITWVDDFEVINDDVVVARAFDNRVGTWSAAEALRLLSEDRSGLSAEVWAVATVQEEIGGRGAGMAAYSLEPDICIAVDVTHATDTPGISKQKHGDIRMGDGPTVSSGSANHPVLVQRLLEVAARCEIAVQREATPRRTGTDLDTIYIQRGGIVSANLGIPNRYMHTSVEMVRLIDLERTAGLLAAFSADLHGGESIRVEIDVL